MRDRNRQRELRTASSRNSDAGAFVMLVLIVWGVWYVFFRDDEGNKPKQFHEQLAALENASRTLGELEAFIEQQKVLLEDRQGAIGRLQSRAEALEKVVEADRVIVEALLSEQQAKYRAELWQERVISFVIGVASSLFATFVWVSIRRRHGVKPKQSSDAE